MNTLSTAQLEQIADILRADPAHAELLHAIEIEQFERRETDRQLTWDDQPATLADLNRAFLQQISKTASDLLALSDRQLLAADYADVKPLWLRLIRLRNLASEYTAALQRRQIPIEWQDK